MALFVINVCFWYSAYRGIYFQEHYDSTVNIREMLLIIEYEKT